MGTKGRATRLKLTLLKFNFLSAGVKIGKVSRLDQNLDTNLMRDRVSTVTSGAIEVASEAWGVSLSCGGSLSKLERLKWGEKKPKSSISRK